jgi:phosphatidylserine decarboxylase
MNLRLKKGLIHKDGIGFFIIFLIVSAFLANVSVILGCFGVFAALWCLYFFRIPSRATPNNPGVLVSPADGRVVSVAEVIPPQEFAIGNETRTRISIFLSIFDVHINYIPILGKIRNIYYQKGHFFHAGKEKASEQNEKNTLIIDIPYGNKNDIAVVQIAGLIARRIRCDVKKGDGVVTGQYYGLIRFGSRLEVYLPKGTSSSVQVGDRVLAAKTILTNIPK